MMKIWNHHFFPQRVPLIKPGGETAIVDLQLVEKQETNQIRIPT